MLTEDKIKGFRKSKAKLSSEIKGHRNPEKKTCEILITPVLDDLGWGGRYDNMITNEKDSAGYIPDYKLLGKGKKPIVFVEAKKLNISWKKSKRMTQYIEQLRNYGKTEEDKGNNIELLVLTDGNVWRFYLPSRLKGYKDFYYDVGLDADNFGEDLNKLLDHESVLSCQSSRYLKILFHLDRIKKEYESIKSLPETHEQLEEDADLVSRKIENIGFDLTPKKFRQTVAKKLDETKQVAGKKQMKPRPGPKAKPGKPKKLEVKWGNEEFEDEVAIQVMHKVIISFANKFHSIGTVASAANECKGDGIPTVMANTEVDTYKEGRKSVTHGDIDGYPNYVYLKGLSSTAIADRLNLLAKELNIPDDQFEIKLDGKLYRKLYKRHLK